MATTLKAHGAWLGGGTGVGLAGLLVGLLQQATHHTLATIDVQAVYSLVAVGGAFFGAHLLPVLQRDVPGLVSQDSLGNAERIAAALRDEVTELRQAKGQAPAVGGYVSGPIPVSGLAPPPASVTTPVPPTP